MGLCVIFVINCRSTYPAFFVSCVPVCVVCVCYFESYPQGQVIQTIFGVLIGAMASGQMAPGLTALGKAKQAAYKVFETLERVPTIDASSPDGSKPESVEGRLEFKEVGGCRDTTCLADPISTLYFLRVLFKSGKKRSVPTHLYTARCAKPAAELPVA